MAEQPGTDSLQRGHETSDADVRILLMLAGALLLMVIAVIGGLYAWIVIYSNHPPAHQAFPGARVGITRIPPAPRLQVNSPDVLADGAAQRAPQPRDYRWVDRRQGLVEIPVARAMEVLARKVRQPAAQAPAIAPSQPAGASKGESPASAGQRPTRPGGAGASPKAGAFDTEGDGS